MDGVEIWAIQLRARLKWGWLERLNIVLTNEYKCIEMKLSQGEIQPWRV